MKEEKNLGVIMQENIKIGKQVSAAALTANSMLDLIRRSFVNRKKNDGEIVKKYMLYLI